MQNPSLPLPKSRQRLSQLAREVGDVFDVTTASKILDLHPMATAKQLARWTEQGWLRRVAQGRYVTVSLDLLVSERVISDPWILVPALFDPGYIGGRTAAEYWGLTEQLFNDITVFTTANIRQKIQRHDGIKFNLKHMKQSKLFGTTTVWRGQSKVLVSDTHRTIIDMLDDPMIGGGLQHANDCLAAFLKRSDCCYDTLIDYAKRLNNGAVFKRLGFLLETLGEAPQLQARCAEHLTHGHAKLDPLIPQGKIVTRWRLIVPHGWLRTQTS